MCKTAATPTREVTVQAPDNEIVHSNNVYGLISVDAGSNELDGG